MRIFTVCLMSGGGVFDLSYCDTNIAVDYTASLIYPDLEVDPRSFSA